MNTYKTIELAQKLIREPSITPNDFNCQKIIAERLKNIGFKAKHLKFGEVDNLWIEYGFDKPLFVFAGHTDVVPTGDVKKWDEPPFSANIKDDYIYGRGSADMKSSIAAMIVALEEFIKINPKIKGSIALLITSDEEGAAIDGTAKVIDWLKSQNKKINYCLVGEPSAINDVGDTIKNGRRGSLNCELKIVGKQGHIAYPHLADNPIHKIVSFLNELCAKKWDKGNKYFPPTSMQISNIYSGTGAHNVIPDEIDIYFNFRYSTETSEKKLKQEVQNIIDNYDFKYEIIWSHSGNPFITNEGDLSKACASAIKKITGLNTNLSTTGGTSDGRFIAPYGAQVIELGPVNASIHQINERVSVTDLEKLTKIYYHILEELLL